MADRGHVLIGRTISLRLRLFLAFVATALVMAALGFFALRQSWQMRRQVTDLTSVSIARFEHDRTVGKALEIEVDPGAGGSWIADEIEVLGGPRRPKLRGPLDEIDPGSGRIRMFGQDISVPADVEADDLPDGGLAGLRPGDRIEVSCSIDDDGAWRARKLRTEGLKGSNKIKGVVTAVSMDGTPPDSMAISGITILFDLAGRAPDPRIELKRIALATRMTLLAQDCALAAPRALSGSDAAFITADGEVTDAATLLAESAADLREAVARARDVGRAGPANPLGLDNALWLEPLEQHVAELDRLTALFLDSLESGDEAAADRVLRTDLEPLLVDDVRPLIHNYLRDAEERLALEVDHLAGQADTTARALIVASGLAMFTAMALGWLVYRSLNAPLQRLTDAAARMGQGRLDTRVEIRSRDELGMLADTLNRMARDLESSTVSIANLDDILESMAGALFVLDGGGRVKSANAAAGDLAGVAPGALAGRLLTEFCSPGAGGGLLPVGDRTCSGEAALRRADGGVVPVSFSAAALASGDGPAGGFVWVAQDLSGRIAMEEQLRRSLAEKELLLREVHHRVKNNLQVISSLLEMQGDTIEDDQARSVYADSQSRIRSMALIHQQLYGASTLDRIDFGAYLEELAGSLLQFHGSGPGRVAIEARADRVQLAIDRALTCGLIVNELVTNALKHAFAPGSEGLVTVDFRAEGEDCRLQVADNGSGLAGDRQDGDSLGMSLIAALVDQLGGRMDITGSGGTTFTIMFPQKDVA